MGHHLLRQRFLKPIIQQIKLSSIIFQNKDIHLVTHHGTVCHCLSYTVYIVCAEYTRTLYMLELKSIRIVIGI